MQAPKIVHLYLTDGKELLATHIGSASWSDMILENPMVIEEIQMGEAGKGHMVLYSYIPYTSDRKVTIKNSHIISSCEVDSHVVELYDVAVKYYFDNIGPRVKRKIGEAVSLYKEFQFEEDSNVADVERDAYLVIPEKHEIH